MAATVRLQALGNRLQMALVREAAYIVAEGIADAEDVDTVARNGFGLRMPAYGIRFAGTAFCGSTTYASIVCTVHVIPLFFSAGE